MPRMSREKRLEWSFFLNHRNRIAYNALCRSCTHGCKQSFRAIVVLCPHYWSIGYLVAFRRYRMPQIFLSRQG